MKCTWEGCTLEATHPQLSNDDSVWANLCDIHHSENDKAMHDLFNGKGPAGILRSWIKAQGGVKAAATRMVSR